MSNHIYCPCKDTIVPTRSSYTLICLLLPILILEGVANTFGDSFGPTDTTNIIMVVPFSRKEVFYTNFPQG